MGICTIRLFAAVAVATIGFVSGGKQTSATRIVTVARDGSGQFSTVQAAIDSVPNTRKVGERVIIHIKPGVYKGPIVVSSSKAFITFEGESAEKTVLTNDWSATKLRPTDNKPYGTSGSASVVLEGDDFQAKNITFENSAGRGKDVGQAVAVKLTADRAVFENCRFLGWQDTLYANGANARQYFHDCFIAGEVDFIFGSAAAVFDHCRISCKGAGYISAQSRLTPENGGGYVFRDCDIVGAAGVAPGVVYLGRPWRDYSRVVYLNCRLDTCIRPAGWDNWRDPRREKTAFYAEYHCTGPGAVTTARVPWVQTLTNSQAEVFETKRFLAGSDNWNPQ